MYPAAYPSQEIPLSDERRAMHETVEWAIRRTGLHLPTPVFPAEPLVLEPELEAAPAAPEQRHAAVTAGSLAVLATLALLYTLYLASSVVLPVVVAILLSFLLRGPVRWLKKHKVREPLGAAVVVFGSGLLVVGALVLLSGPASDWIARAPSAMGKVEAKLRTIAARYGGWCGYWALYLRRG